MGVQGLWSILHGTGRDIDLSSLGGKVIAIDVSIWLNQALRSGIDSPNAHLEIVFRRICKLLFYKIKPVFVFDGPSPSLKLETIIARRKQRQIKLDRSEQIKSSIIKLLMKKKVTEKRKRPSKEISTESRDLFKLPENEYFDKLVQNNFENDFGFSDIASDYLNNFQSANEINFESESFQSMPLEVQHEVIRNVAREKRYGQDSISENLSEKSAQEFSHLQIQKLLNRNSLQQKVENLRTTMNYRNNQNVIGSLKCQPMRNLSVQNVQSKKILSRNDGYLMMIDPSESDLVDTLTKLKREYLFPKITGVNKEADQEVLFEENNRDSLISSKCDCNSLEKTTKSIEKEPLKDLNHDDKERFPVAASPWIDSEQMGLFTNHISSSSPDVIGSLANPVALEQCELSGTNNPMVDKHFQSKDNLIYTPKECFINIVPNISVINEIVTLKSPMISKESPNEIIPDIVQSTDLSQSIDSIETQALHGDCDQSKHVEDCSIMDNAKDTVENEESQSTEDSDDDNFVEVPELEETTDDLPESQLFSEADIEMIMNDPIKWQENIDETISDLYNEERKIESQAASMSERYYQDAKDLLKLFGIPYVDSPGEAEAQCAFLEKINLTEGTITEDSDIWLFGGQMVYKHVFNRDCSVRAYDQKFIYKKLGLTQDLMVCIALLSGSDYSPGIYGIGPVIAMEILAEFSNPDIEQSNFEVLRTFKEWLDKWSESTSPYSGNPNKKRFLRFKLNSNFPDYRIIEAYYKPLIDESIDPFVWSKPSIDKLVEFIHSKIGWEPLKVLEMLDVIIDKNKSGSKMFQKPITDYFNDSPVEDLINSKKSPSKRLKLATNQRNLFVQKINKCFK